MQDLAADIRPFHTPGPGRHKKKVWVAAQAVAAQEPPDAARPEVFKASDAQGRRLIRRRPRLSGKNPRAFGIYDQNRRVIEQLHRAALFQSAEIARSLSGG